jgi:hypothetical protein
MPTPSSNQGILIPDGPDPADNPQAFNDQLGGYEGRLNMRFTNLADRTARVLVPVENQVSFLGAEDRADAYDGAAWVSLAARAMYARRMRTTNAAVIISSTVLVSDLVLQATLDVIGTFTIRGRLYYDASATADVKMALTWPTASAAKWGAIGRNAATQTNVDALTSTVSGTPLALGGNGVGTETFFDFDGYMTTTATGVVQVSYAQNTSDPTNLTIRSGSYFEIVKTN